MTEKKAPWPRDGIYRPELGIWLVPSRSTPGAFWRVTWTTSPRTGIRFLCTCPAGRERGEMTPAQACRHVRAAATAEQADGLPPRPAARVDPGTFVD